MLLSTGLGAIACGVSDDRAIAPGSDGASPERPDLLVILADDMRWDEWEHLPMLDSLARLGTTFTQARQSTPLCSPARATFLRGQVATGPRGHGITSQRSDVRTIEGDTVATWLQAAGYDTAVIDKYPLGPVLPPSIPGWDSTVVSVGDDRQSSTEYSVWTGSGEPTRPDEHASTYFSDVTVERLRIVAEPSFTWYCPREPHGPFEATDPPDPGDASWIDWPFSTDGLDGKPAWVRSLPEPTDRDIALMRGFQRERIAELADLDRAVAAVWDELERSGRADRTVVVVTSDNGNALLDFGRLPTLAKNFPYDLSARVPLVAVGPGFAAGDVVDVPVSAGVDLAATCVAVAGASPTVPLHGIDLRRVATDASLDRRAVVGGNEAVDTGTDMPPSDWVVQGGRKLIRYRDVTGDDRYEAYDVIDDPYELHTWASEAGRRSERDELDALLDRMLDDPAAEP